MSEKYERNRTRPLVAGVRLTREEMGELQARAKEARLNVSDYLRTLIMDTVPDSEAWRRDARCQEYPAELWFPEQGDGASSREARSVCRTCPVAAQCLAMGWDNEFGMFGGMTARERGDVWRPNPRRSGRAA